MNCAWVKWKTISARFHMFIMNEWMQFASRPPESPIPLHTSCNQKADTSHQCRHNLSQSACSGFGKVVTDPKAADDLGSLQGPGEETWPIPSWGSKGHGARGHGPGQPPFGAVPVWGAQKTVFVVLVSLQHHAERGDPQKKIYLFGLKGCEKVFIKLLTKELHID